MDARHISHEKKALNAIIKFINRQMNSKSWIINADFAYHQKLRQIVEKIYQYSSMSVNVNEYLSPKNITEIGMVPLPDINTDLIPNPVSFSDLLQQLITITEEGKFKNNQLQAKLEQKLMRIYIETVRLNLLNEYGDIMHNFAKSLNGYLTQNQQEMLLNEGGQRDDVDFISQQLHHHLGIDKHVNSHKVDLANLNVGISKFKDNPLTEQINGLQEFLTLITERLNASPSCGALQNTLSPHIESSHDVLIRLNKIAKKN